MRKSILITGQNDLLEKPLIELFLNSSYHVFSTSSAEGDVKKTKGLHTIVWNQRSPLSAKNVILSTASVTETIDEAVVLFSSPKILKPFHEITASEIETTLDYYIKSNLFVIKEILAYFQKQHHGTLSLVKHQTGTDVLPPLEAFSSGGFDNLVKSLFAFYQNEKLSINAYLSSASDAEEYSSFIHKTITERQKTVHGKYYKYPEKSVLSALGISKKH